MNKALAIGLVTGLALGLIGGALIAKSKQPRDKETVIAPPSPPPPPPAPAAPKEPAPDPEVEKLRTEIAELKKKLEAKAKTEAARDDATTDFEKSLAAKPEWQEKLDALLKKGLGQYKSADFMAMVGELKKLGKEGIDKLAEKLLQAETAGERFLAAALLEELDDPSAIPALAKSLQQDDDLLVRRMSSHAIAMIENEAGLTALRAAMSADADWGVRVNSAYGVAKLGQPDGVKMLEDAYASASTPAEYKLAVLGGLADVASPSSAPVFRKVLSESTDITYLYIVIGAVEKLKDKSFLPDLNRIAGDAKYAANVREMAKKAADGLAK